METIIIWLYYLSQMTTDMLQLSQLQFRPLLLDYDITELFLGMINMNCANSGAGCA